MARIAAKITLTEKQEKILHQLSNARTVPRHVQRSYYIAPKVKPILKS